MIKVKVDLLQITIFVAFLGRKHDARALGITLKILTKRAERMT